MLNNLKEAAIMLGGFCAFYTNKIHKHCLNNKVFLYHMCPIIHKYCLKIEITLTICYILVFFNSNRYFFLMKVIKKRRVLGLASAAVLTELCRVNF